MERDADWDAFEREIFGAVDKRERERGWELAAEIRRQADRISAVILHSDLPRVDVEIEIRAFRDRVLELFPDKGELFEGVYVSRFRRLWSQWRPKEEPLMRRGAFGAGEGGPGAGGGPS